MNRSIEFHVPMEPVPQPRPSPQVFQAKPGQKAFARIYTPDKTVKPWKAAVALYAQRHIPEEPWDGPVRVDITLGFERQVQMTRPGWPKDALHADNDGTPDLDNLAKPIMDELTRLRLWNDDAQVVKLCVGKLYVEAGDAPGAWVRCELLEAADDLSARVMLASARQAKEARQRARDAKKRIQVPGIFGVPMEPRVRT